MKCGTPHTFYVVPLFMEKLKCGIRLEGVVPPKPALLKQIFILSVVTNKDIIEDTCPFGCGRIDEDIIEDMCHFHVEGIVIICNVIKCR